MKFKFDHIKFIIFFLILILTPQLSDSALKVHITQGNSQKIPIAIKICNKSDHDLWNEISAIIKYNLNNSGIAQIVDDRNNSISCNKSASISQTGRNDHPHNHTMLVALYANYINDKIDVKFTLFDTMLNMQLASKSFNSNMKNHRRVGHMISDIIYTSITGNSGYFDTTILYIAESLGKKRVAIMDQDGKNNSFITSGDSLTLTPRFSPDNKKIVYTLYTNNQAKVYYHDLLTDTKKMVGKFSGIVSAPRFSPDGKSIIVARSIGAETDIYSIDIKTDACKKLTVKSAINTSPSYSPDQKRIAFNSDRTGSPQIYIMNHDGSNQKKISKGLGSYMSPSWSPKGDLIAFTKVYKRHFYIGLMNVDGTDERILTDGYLVESPNWSPNGRLIIFTKEPHPIKNKRSKPEIHTIDIMGFNERVIKLEHGASEPSWSSLLK